MLDSMVRLPPTLALYCHDSDPGLFLDSSLILNPEPEPRLSPDPSPPLSSDHSNCPHLLMSFSERSPESTAQNTPREGWGPAGTDNLWRAQESKSSKDQERWGV